MVNMLQTQFLLSIITINYNNLFGLKDTFNSIFNQTYQEFEYIVIDGGSTDGSIDTITNNASRINYWISEFDKGIYDAMNKGISKANGKYLMFLNSGDCLMSKDTLSRCHNILLSNPKVDIFYGDIFTGNNDFTKSWIHKHPEELNLYFLKFQNLNHQASFISLSLFREFGLYPLIYKLAGDHWIFLKAFISNKIFKHIDLALVIYKYNGQSSINRALYENEMDSIWQKLVPAYTNNLINQIHKYQTNSNFLLVKIATCLSLKATNAYTSIKYRAKRIKVRIKKLRQ